MVVPRHTPCIVSVIFLNTAHMLILAMSAYKSSHALWLSFSAQQSLDSYTNNMSDANESALNDPISQVELWTRNTMSLAWY